MLKTDPASFIDDAEIEARKQLLNLTAEDAKRLRELAPVLRPVLQRFVTEALVKEAGRFAEPSGLLGRITAEGRAEAVIAKVAAAFEQQLSGLPDRAYTNRRIEIGRVHARIGLAPKWYIGALSLVQEKIAEHLLRDEHFGKDPARALAATRSLAKIVYYDMMVVLDAYAEHSMGETIRSQEEALRELSAPVIEVWEEILVLPLVGTMDTRRAQEATEAILNGVVEKKAKFVIIDITGLPVMDTSTANHLFKTVRAVELLGANAIITGVRPAIAQTVVSLGIDTTALRTRARLVDGLRLALELTGRKVVDRADDGAASLAALNGAAAERGR